MRLLGFSPLFSRNGSSKSPAAKEEAAAAAPQQTKEKGKAKKANRRHERRATTFAARLQSADEAMQVAIQLKLIKAEEHDDAVGENALWGGTPGENQLLAYYQAVTAVYNVNFWMAYRGWTRRAEETLALQPVLSTQMMRKNHAKMARYVERALRERWWMFERMMLSAIGSATSAFELPGYPILDVNFEGGVNMCLVEPGADALRPLVAMEVPAMVVSRSRRSGDSSAAGLTCKVEFSSFLAFESFGSTRNFYKRYLESVEALRKQMERTLEQTQGAEAEDSGGGGGAILVNPALVRAVTPPGTAAPSRSKGEAARGRARRSLGQLGPRSGEQFDIGGSLNGPALAPSLSLDLAAVEPVYSMNVSYGDDAAGGAVGGGVGDADLRA